MSENRIDITVISAPSYITSECPHCGEEIHIDYKDFTDMMVHDYWEDWTDETIKCPECGKEVTIGSIEWDD